MRGGVILVIITFLLLFDESCNKVFITTVDHLQNYNNKILKFTKEYYGTGHDKYFVDKTTAIEVAKNFLTQLNKSGSSSNHNIVAISDVYRNSLQIKDVYHIDDNSDIPMIYIINFDKIGNVIVSGTKKDHPVLGYAPVQFNFDSLNFQYLDWLVNRLKIVDAKNKNQLGFDSTLKEWAALGIYDTIFLKRPLLSYNNEYEALLNNSIQVKQPFIGQPEAPPGVCTYTYLPISSSTSSNYVLPLCNYRFGQLSPYNYYCPILPECKFTYQEATSPLHLPALTVPEHALVGCVAVAMANIVSYFNRSNTRDMLFYVGTNIANNTVNYSKISQNVSYSDSLLLIRIGAPDSLFLYSLDIDLDGVFDVSIYQKSGKILADGFKNTAILLRLCGVLSNMNYGCNESGAFGGPGAFVGFGLTARTIPYNRADVINSLINRKPVYMEGYTNQDYYYADFWDWLHGRRTYYGTGSGHAWVVDGLKQLIFTTNYQVIIDCDENNIQSLNTKPQTSEPTTESITHTAHYFNMNWGWGWAYSWHIADDFGGFDFVKTITLF